MNYLAFRSFYAFFIALISVFLGISFSYPVFAAIPNDPLYGHQWALKQIEAEQAWKYTTGTSDVVIAVIDGGVDIRHPDLWPNIWVNKAEKIDDGIDNDGNGYIDDIFGWNFVNNSAWVAPMEAAYQYDDSWSHGTIVASLIGAKGDNQEGIAGVTWNSKIMPLVVLDGDGFGNISGVIRAIRYAVDNGADIINLSLTGYENDPDLDEAIRDAEAANVLVVVAAGNDAEVAGRDLAEIPIYPACSVNASSTLIAVTGTDVLDQRAPYADYGAACTDLAAPGHDLIAARPTRNPSSPFVTSTLIYVDRITGTSAAAPLVSGAAALIWGVRPEFTVRQVRDILLNSAQHIEPDTPIGSVGKLGRGRLHLGRAIQTAVKGKQNKSILEPPTIPTVNHGRQKRTWMFLEQL